MNEELANRIEELAKGIKAEGKIPELLEAMAWTAARIAQSAQLQATPSHKEDLGLMRDHLQAVATVLRSSGERESATRDALDAIDNDAVLLLSTKSGKQEFAISGETLAKVQAALSSLKPSEGESDKTDLAKAIDWCEGYREGCEDGEPDDNAMDSAIEFMRSLSASPVGESAE